MSPRIIQLPLSGRDKRHYVGELRKAETAYGNVRRECDAAKVALDLALSKYYRLTAEEWSILQFIGGDAAPSPTIAEALTGGCELLEAQCQTCNHTDLVDLTLSIWPRGNQVHTLKGALYCKRCMQEHGKKRRPDLVALRIRERPDPAAPAASKQKRD
jgi:hypothetical protein